MMNDLYYVYLHSEPETGDTVYIGHGYRDRAWCLQANTRSKEHLKWADNLMAQGYIPDEFVEIVIRNLTKSAACVEEQEMIRKLKPKFNKPMGVSSLKITPEQVEIARKMRADGHYYLYIGNTLGLASMTIHRALNGKTKNIDS